MLTLSPGESVIGYAEGGTVTLTTQRIFKQEKGRGKPRNHDIKLEHITSCENHSVAYVVLLMLSFISFFLAITAGIERNKDFRVALALGTVLLLSYLLTKKKQVIIASPNTTMNINVSGMTDFSIADFVDKVQQARNNRIAELNDRKQDTATSYILSTG